MATLNPDSLSVTLFETASSGAIPVGNSDNCGSPLCMTDDPVCTTPWCPRPTQTQPVDTIAG